MAFEAMGILRIRIAGIALIQLFQDPAGGVALRYIVGNFCSGWTGSFRQHEVGGIPELPAEVDQPAPVVAYHFLSAVYFLYQQFPIRKHRKCFTLFHGLPLSRFYLVADRVRNDLQHFFFSSYRLHFCKQ